MQCDVCLNRSMSEVEEKLTAEEGCLFSTEGLIVLVLKDIRVDVCCLKRGTKCLPLFSSLYF